MFAEKKIVISLTDTISAWHLGVSPAYSLLKLCMNIERA